MQADGESKKLPLAGLKVIAAEQYGAGPWGTLLGVTYAALYAG